MSGADDALRVAVPLGPRSYEIQVVSDAEPGRLGAFVQGTLGRSWAGRGCRRALVVTDAHLAPYLRPVTASLEAIGLDVASITLPAGEATKCLDRAAELYRKLADLPADRHTLVVAFGGGVIGDLAGFAAATFARGLPLFMVPTSLLAQVDSSVGGKVGINLPGAKNLVGSFHQPIGVWIDTASLDTLPEPEYRSGLAEVVKYGVILDAAFFDELEAAAPAILARNPAIVRRMVARSCELKAEVVTKDELEQTGLRAVLNFGHTIGHAVEADAGYGGLRHGEAVAIGMVAESRLAERLGWIRPDLTARLEALLTALGLPTAVKSKEADRLIDAMSRDKKNRGGKIRFVLPRKLGKVELTDAPDEADIRHALAASSVPAS
jgi:3-dehydroquinate synthase